MILNLYTVILLFISVTTGILGIVLGLLSFRIYQRWNREDRALIEDRGYLLILIATVVLLVKLLSWPIFYVTLWSYIPYIQGAMCIFGVTQAQALLSGIVQIYKPLVFFFIIGWLLLNKLDNSTETAPLFKRKFLFLFILSLFIMVDSGMDFFYLLNFNADVDVGCCSTVFDLPRGTTSTPSLSVLSAWLGDSLLLLYYLSNLFLILFLGICYRRVKSGYSLVLIIIAVLLSIVNSGITVSAMFEIIAPKIMNLPDHHCIYCMWQYSPSSILITALFIIGTFSPGWALLLYAAGRDKETFKNLHRYLRSLYLISMITLGISSVMVAMHIFLI
jgi:hypothetical protein